MPPTTCSKQAFPQKDELQELGLGGQQAPQTERGPAVGMIRPPPRSVTSARNLIIMDISAHVTQVVLLTHWLPAW